GRAASPRGPPRRRSCPLPSGRRGRIARAGARRWRSPPQYRCARTPRHSRRAAQHALGVGSSYMQISGARVLLTGATGGLGPAIARALAQRGGQLVLTGRRAEVLDPLATELGARALTMDLAQPGAVERLLEEAGEVD